MKKQTLIKIIVPTCMVLVIAGIWLFRNPAQVDEAQSQQTAQSASYDSQTQQEASEGDVQQIEQVSEQSAFPLNISEVDVDEITSHGMPVIVDFGADECVPCVEMAPVLEELNEEMQETAIIQFVDVWKNPGGATGFPVQVIPTQIFYDAQGNPYMPTADVGVELVQYTDKDTGEHIFTAHQGGLTEEQMRAILADMGVE